MEKVSVQQEKKRGKFLTVLLVLGFVGVITSIPTIFNTHIIEQAYGKVPGWYLPYAIFGLSLGLLNIIGIWKWKKWTVYVLGLSAVLSIVMQLFILKPITPGVAPVAIVSSLISSGLWFWAIYRKWQYFE